MGNTESTLRNNMVVIAKSFFMRGLASGSSGNMSIRLPNGGFIATPTGSSMNSLTADSLSTLDNNGNHIGGLKPTKEILIHLACYSLRSDCNAIVHLHSPYATAVSCLSNLNPQDAVLPLTPYGLMRYGRVGFVPYHAPGSNGLLTDITAKIPQHAALLLGNHGQLMTGKNLDAAASNADELEDSCRLLILTQGHNVRVLTPEEQTDLLNRQP